MGLVLDVHNTLTNPSLHDGFVDTLHVGEDDSAFIECRADDGRKVTIRFLGISGLQGNDFRAGNIISAISIYRGALIPLSAIQQLLCFNTPVKAMRDAEIIEETLKSNVYCFILEPAYGLELKVICRQVLIE